MAQAIVSAESIRTLVTKGKQHRPELASRLERAAMIVLFRTIQVADAAHHEYRVESESEQGRYYRVNGQCSCADYGRAPGHFCKHRLAVALVERASEDAERARQTRQAVETEWMAAATVRGY